MSLFCRLFGHRPGPERKSNTWSIKGRYRICRRCKTHLWAGDPRREVKS
ncbi:MAG: DUF1660 family phage protein [bacterium]